MQQSLPVQTDEDVAPGPMHALPGLPLCTNCRSGCQTSAARTSRSCRLGQQGSCKCAPPRPKMACAAWIRASASALLPPLVPSCVFSSTLHRKRLFKGLACSRDA